MTKYCPKCKDSRKAEYSKPLNFCIMCGAKLLEEVPTCGCGHRLNLEMYCPNCGKKNTVFYKDDPSHI